jgi:hypothetical protein
MAAAAVMQEKGKKGDEKTSKKISEENRKHAKREAWRAKQAANLAKLKKEADHKIAKESKTKAKQIAKAKKADAEVTAKKKKIHANVKALKTKAIAKAAAKKAKLGAIQKKDAAKLAKIKSASTEKDKKVIMKVQNSVSALAKKALAKQTLRLAKIKAASDKTKAQIHKKFLADQQTLLKKFADQKKARLVAASKISAYDKLLTGKDKKYDTKMKALDSKADQAMKKREAKERHAKVKAMKATKIAMEKRFKGSPGAKKVQRLERRQARETVALRRQVSRTDRRKVRAAADKMEDMAKSSSKAFEEVLKTQSKVLAKAVSSTQEANAPAANELVAQAWNFALKGEPLDKAEAEAVQVARGGAVDLTPHSSRLQTPREASASDTLQGAWSTAFGNHAPKEHSSVEASNLLEVAPQAQSAFAEALGVGPLTRDAHRSDHRRTEHLEQAWGAALGRNVDQGTLRDQLALEAVGFSGPADGPPTENVLPGDDPTLQNLPQDEVEVAMAAHSALQRSHMKRADEEEEEEEEEEEGPDWAHSADPSKSAEEAVAAIMARNGEALPEKHPHNKKEPASVSAPPVQRGALKLKAVKPAKVLKAERHAVEIGSAVNAETLEEEKSAPAKTKQGKSPKRKVRVAPATNAPASVPATVASAPATLTEDSAREEKNDATKGASLGCTALAVSLLAVLRATAW